MEFVNTFVFVKRGSLTSTINSKEFDPVNGGRSNALKMGTIYWTRATQMGIELPIKENYFN